ncbi:MAG: radical SAM protein [Planctomycetes bacterium]|nr:radical SAM protein [Planctomycetota bacterium]
MLVFYSHPVFRPPSERDSLLIQVTVGCSRRSCTFCLSSLVRDAYVRDRDSVLADIAEAGEKYRDTTRKVFFLSASAIAADTATLVAAAAKCRELFPNLRSISSYAHSLDVQRKSDAELSEIAGAGLGRLYIGIESGSDAVLRFVRKGGTVRQIEQACLRAADAGITLSCQVILGLGGVRLTREHAEGTARLLGEVSPHYVGFLNLMVVPKTRLEEDVAAGRFELVDNDQYVDELETMIEGIEPRRRPIVVRSNHPSNYLSLAGTLPQDRESLLEAIRAARVGAARFSEEFLRNL